MDPKLPGTDPKLQEAYDKVMNGPSTPPVGAAVPPPPPPPAPFTPQMNATPMQPQAPVASAPMTPVEATPQPQVGVPPVPMPAGGVAFNAKGGGTVKKGGGKMTSVILGLGVIVLLVAYTFVWIYVFKLQVPGLPQF